MTKLRLRPGAFCCWRRRQLLDSTDRSGLAATRDHINPQALGGGKWVFACRKCNMLKGSLHPLEWFWFIDHHPRWWKTFGSNVAVSAVVREERLRRVRSGEAHLTPEPMGGYTAGFQQIGIGR